MILPDTATGYEEFVAEVKHRLWQYGINLTDEQIGIIVEQDRRLSSQGISGWAMTVLSVIACPALSELGE